MTQNPLLEISTLPNGAPAFDRIGTEHYKPAVEAAIAEAKANLAALKTNKDTPDFANTITALEAVTETFGSVTGVFYNQLSSMGGDALHALATELGPLGAALSSDIILDPELFTRVKTVYDAREKQKYTAEQTTLLRDTYREFVRGGALLDDEKKARLRAINEQLSVLGPAFMNNSKKSAEAFELFITDEKDLAGLPDSAIEGARHAAQEKGRADAWLFTLDIPSYLPFMQYAQTRALREQVWRAYGSRGWGGAFDNAQTVLKIVQLAHERAALLGYETPAHYVLEERMAENPETVREFLERLKGGYLPQAQKDLEALRKFAKDTEGLDDLKPWDVAYYSEKLKHKLFDFSDEDLRPYFPLQTVLDGCFRHFSRLFGVTFKPAQGYPVWHADVKVYELSDEKDGRFIGTLYGDFHPRSGKKDGAWMTQYRAQGLFRGKIERPLVAIVCNFTKPTPARPSLLTHDEVLTLFHEMGHAMHGLLSDVTHRSVSGINVLWDFVELPSQVQENWCYERETLDMLSSHYQSGEKIPAALVEKLRDAKNFMTGVAGLRQVCFATLDMAWFRENPKTIIDVAAFEDAHTKGLTLFPRMAGPFSASFSHIFAGGYAAGYYSYKWAEVLDADTFELFLEKGLYDRETARRYREDVLARGGSEHPSVLYRKFRGRDADPAALFRREGMAG